MKTQEETPEKTGRALVEFEEIKARNPISGEIETVRIEKEVHKTPEQVEAGIKAQLKKYGLEAVEQVTVRDPLTGKLSNIVIDRTGFNEKKLIVALADPKVTREQKDHFLSMYLWERGSENSSFMVDLIRYKGEHTKESRLFSARTKMDFDAFVGSFTHYLQEQSNLLGITLGVDIDSEKKLFENWLQEKRDFDKKIKDKNPDYVMPSYHYIDFAMVMKDRANKPFSDEFNETDRMKAALIEMAIYSFDEANRLRMAMDNITKARQAMKGGGIYVDRMGRPYDANDPALDEVIKAERKIQEDLNNDDK